MIPDKSLAEILAHHMRVGIPIPVPLTLSILGQVCNALEYAHNLRDPMGNPLGIVHGDVSPAHIYLSATGTATLVGRTAPQAAFAYMAPEYVMTGMQDARADLFALGVVAHEMLANRPLFAAGDDRETLDRVCQLPIPPSAASNPLVAPDLDGVVFMALARDPSYRWQQASMLRDGLWGAAHRLGIDVASVGPQAWTELLSIEPAGGNAAQPPVSPHAGAPTLFADPAPPPAHAVTPPVTAPVAPPGAKTMFGAAQPAPEYAAPSSQTKQVPSVSPPLDLDAPPPARPTPLPPILPPVVSTPPPVKSFALSEPSEYTTPSPAYTESTPSSARFGKDTAPSPALPAFEPENTAPSTAYLHSAPPAEVTPPPIAPVSRIAPVRASAPLPQLAPLPRIVPVPKAAPVEPAPDEPAPDVPAPAVEDEIPVEVDAASPDDDDASEAAPPAPPPADQWDDTNEATVFQPLDPAFLEAAAKVAKLNARLAAAKSGTDAKGQAVVPPSGVAMSSDDAVRPVARGSNFANSPQSAESAAKVASVNARLAAAARAEPKEEDGVRPVARPSSSAIDDAVRPVARGTGAARADAAEEGVRPVARDSKAEYGVRPVARTGPDGLRAAARTPAPAADPALAPDLAAALAAELEAARTSAPRPSRSSMGSIPPANTPAPQLAPPPPHDDEPPPVRFSTSSPVPNDFTPVPPPPSNQVPRNQFEPELGPEPTQIGAMPLISFGDGAVVSSIGKNPPRPALVMPQGAGTSMPEPTVVKEPPDKRIVMFAIIGIVVVVLIIVIALVTR